MSRCSGDVSEGLRAADITAQDGTPTGQVELCAASGAQRREAADEHFAVTGDRVRNG